MLTAPGTEYDIKEPMTARFLWFFFLFTPTHLRAQGVSMIEFQHVQLVRSLAGVVHDAAAAPMAGVLVQEFTSDWKRALRSIKTDDAGHFALGPVRGRHVYLLQLTFKGFNPIRVRVEIDAKRGKELQLKMEVST